MHVKYFSFIYTLRLVLKLQKFGYVVVTKEFTFLQLICETQ